MLSKPLPEPWKSFFAEIDSALNQEVVLHCFGGFVASVYEGRLTEMFPGTFKYLRLLALDPYDLALSKIERNSQRDRDDVKHLARVVPFDLELLRSRYEDEIKPDLGNPERESLTLQLWIKAIEEERSQAT